MRFHPFGGPLRRHVSASIGHGRTLGARHPAVVEGRTLFPTTRRRPDQVLRLLKSGFNARKIGGKIQKGAWSGFPVYTLTLEERATCPSACEHWASCYGNNMHFAQRIRHGLNFERRLWSELEALQQAHPGGYAVRLHVLGDFYGVRYARMWERALVTFPALHVFGFTRRWPVGEDAKIGRALFRLSTEWWDRFAIRFSGSSAPMGATTYQAGERPDGIACPAQLGQTDCCSTCALCWSTTKPVAFLQH